MLLFSVFSIQKCLADSSKAKYNYFPDGVENDDNIVTNCIHLNIMNISGYAHGFPVRFGHVDVDFAQCLPTDHSYDAINIVLKEFGNMYILKL